MNTTLLALANDLSRPAEVLRLMSQDLGDPETFALATAAWAISIELERAAEEHALAARPELS
jgi:hypothetical protein